MLRDRLQPRCTTTTVSWLLLTTHAKDRAIPRGLSTIRLKITFVNIYYIAIFINNVVITWKYWPITVFLPIWTIFCLLSVEFGYVLLKKVGVCNLIHNSGWYLVVLNGTNWEWWLPILKYHKFHLVMMMSCTAQMPPPPLVYMQKCVQGWFCQYIIIKKNQTNIYNLYNIHNIWKYIKYIPFNSFISTFSPLSFSKTNNNNIFYIFCTQYWLKFLKNALEYFWT